MDIKNLLLKNNSEELYFHNVICLKQLQILTKMNLGITENLHFYLNLGRNPS